MKKLKILVVAMAAIWLLSCGTVEKAVITLSNNVAVEDTYTIIWNGTSEAYRFIELPTTFNN